jgi:DNA-binding MarR family transcriptional regulator
MRSLAVIGQIATGAYESFGPSAEARKVLEGSEHARNIVGVLVGKDRLQAADLRRLLGIEHQSLVTRIIHTLSSARLVIVEQGPGNTAWYRLTAEGRRAAKAAVDQTGKAAQDAAGKRQLAAAGASSRGL